jgi:hypothetical protein
MKRVLGSLSAAFGLTLVASLLVALPAEAKTIDVMPGQSIQAAIDSASPGDTIVVHPGVYHENVNVNKNNITLRGSGASSDGTVLLPLKNPPKSPLAHVGIGVFNKFDFKTGKVLKESRGVRVSGFLVKNFPNFGIFLYGAEGFVASHNKAVNNGEYGISGFHLHKGKFLHNVAVGSGEAGFYWGDSPKAEAVIRGNSAWGNGFGFLMRDSSHGTVAENRAFRNCVGFIVMNTGESRGPAADWDLEDNDSFHNNKVCKPEEGLPRRSGGGIDLLGAARTRVAHNTVWANRPGKPSPFAGGIVLSTAKLLHGSVESADSVRFNQAYRNGPDDIVWDGKGSATFEGNQCDRSKPRGLCH